MKALTEKQLRDALADAWNCGFSAALSKNFAGAGRAVADRRNEARDLKVEELSKKHCHDNHY